MFYTQSIAKGHIRARQNVLLPQVKFWHHSLWHISLFMTHFTVYEQRSLGEKFNEVEWTGKAEARTVESAAGAACKATFWPTPGLNRGNFDSPGLPPGGTLTCASAVPQHGLNQEEQMFNQLTSIFTINSHHLCEYDSLSWLQLESLVPCLVSLLNMYESSKGLILNVHTIYKYNS